MNISAPASLGPKPAIDRGKAAKRKIPGTTKKQIVKGTEIPIEHKQKK